jgi:nucleoid-associated protein YgaU
VPAASKNVVLRYTERAQKSDHCANKIKLHVRRRISHNKTVNHIREILGILPVAPARRMSMDRFDELKQKYASALAVVQQQGIRLTHLHVQDNKLFMEGAAPSEGVKNALWNQIKAINPIYDDLTANISIDSSLPQPAPAGGGARRTYTVQPGDSLSTIAKHFYGNASDYMRIFDANKDKLNNPNRIQVGQELVIPAST